MFDFRLFHARCGAIQISFAVDRKAEEFCISCAQLASTNQTTSRIHQVSVSWYFLRWFDQVFQKDIKQLQWHTPR